MIHPVPAIGYSADVEIELTIDGRRLSVGQVGRNLLIFDAPVSLPATTGELALTIDGKIRRWTISILKEHRLSRFIEAEMRPIS
jgi:hypothetical protein